MKLRHLAGLLCWLVATAPVWARLGGGETYSGSSSGGYSPSYSSGGSHSSGGGDADLIFFLLELIIRYPAVGIPVALIALGIYVVSQSQHQQHQVYRGEREGPIPGYSPVEVPDADLFHVKPQHDQNPDPNFSYCLFLDFVSLLFAQVQQGRTGDLAQVGHYLSPGVRQQLLRLTQNQGVDRVLQPVVGSARILSQVRIQGQVRLTLTLETNFTEVRGEQQQRLYTRERWTFVRKEGVLSPGPQALHQGLNRLGCPSCGQSGEVGQDGKCPYCDRVVNQGDFGWVVSHLQVLERESRPALNFGQQAVERGTDQPTRRHPQLATRWRTFQARYPDFRWESFESRVRESFLALQQAWSDQDWMKARPYETDALFQTHQYWIEAYRARGVVNELSRIEMGAIERVNLDTDPYFDAITVRVFASMIDVNREKATGKLLGGDPNRPRRFSEYWTFIRKVGFQPGPDRAPGSCPSCGGPLDRVNQVGLCEYCGSHITSGDFDWVLAQIEQDESYRPPSS